METPITKKLQEYLPSLCRDYLNHGNMAPVSEFLKLENVSFGQELVENLLKPMVDELLKNGVNIIDINIGAIVDDTWGWEVSDLENEIIGSTLWVKTDNKLLMNKIKNKFTPEEFSIRENKFRLWWD